MLLCSSVNRAAVGCWLHVWAKLKACGDGAVNYIKNRVIWRRTTANVRARSKLHCDCSPRPQCAHTRLYNCPQKVCGDLAKRLAQRTGPRRRRKAYRLMDRLVTVQTPFNGRFPCSPMIMVVLVAVAVVRSNRQCRQIVATVRQVGVVLHAQLMVMMVRDVALRRFHQRRLDVGDELGHPIKWLSITLKTKIPLCLKTHQSPRRRKVSRRTIYIGILLTGEDFIRPSFIWLIKIYDHDTI